MTTQPYDANGGRVLKRGCRVTDSRPCPQHFDIAEHYLDPRGFGWVHPVLNERTGYCIEPPLPCVADAEVEHTFDDVHLCHKCMPEEKR